MPGRLASSTSTSGVQAGGELQRLGAVLRHPEVDAAQAHRFLEQDRVDAVVLDVEHARRLGRSAAVARRRGRPPAPPRPIGRRRARQHDAHDRAGAPDPAAEVDLAAHRPHEAARSRGRDPRPPGTSVVSRPRRSKGWNSFAAWAGVSPAPVSFDDERDPLAVRAGLLGNADPAARAVVILIALDTALKSTWRRRCASASTRTSA